MDTLEYYQDIEITPNHAHRILDEHGVPDYYQFWDEVQQNERGLYDAQEVFIWLGY
jgi:hypothetical protein